jgi:hypothetical protein
MNTLQPPTLCIPRYPPYQRSLPLSTPHCQIEDLCHLFLNKRHSNFTPFFPTSTQTWGVDGTGVTRGKFYAVSKSLKKLASVPAKSSVYKILSQVFLGTSLSPHHPSFLIRPIPRFRTLIFWIYADREKLEPRLDERVDAMLAVRPLRTSRDHSADVVNSSQVRFDQRTYSSEANCI